jgi:hypothetical protein
MFPGEPRNITELMFLTDEHKFGYGPQFPEEHKPYILRSIKEHN